MSYWGYRPYVSVADKKAKAAKKRQQLMKKNPDLKPVILQGRTLARTWWGKSWNKNLERYADYQNRIERGRSYVRHEAVLDLQIASGKLEALISGSSSRPYSVAIRIQSLKKDVWNKIKVASEGKLESLQELLIGKFPKALEEIFMHKDTGLFPSPKEISFSCTCPDWADMCKHVAASLYGIGARLDEEPSLFFVLRNIKTRDLVTQAVEDQTRKLLKKADKNISNVLDDSQLSDIFGIDLDHPVRIKKRARKAKSTTKNILSKQKTLKRTQTRQSKKCSTKKVTPSKARSNPRKS